MSFLVGLMTGYLNEDTEIMRNQAEYDREQAKTKQALAQELEKEKRVLNQELMKKAITAQYTGFAEYSKKFADGKVAAIPNAQAIVEANIQSIKLTGRPVFDFSSLLQTLDDAEKFNMTFGSGAHAIKTHIDFDKTPSYNNAEALVGFFNGRGNDPQFINKLSMQTPSEKVATLSAITRAENKFKNEYFGQITKGGWNPETTPKKVPTLDGDRYKGLINVKTALGAAIGGPSSIDSKIATYEASMNVSNNEKGMDTYFFIRDNSGNTETPMGITIDKQYEDGFSKVTNKLVPNGNKKAAGYYYANVRDIKDMMGSKLKANDVQNLFFNSVKLANFNGAEGLDPDRRLYKYDDKEILYWYNKVYDGKLVKPGDIDLAAAVLMPSMSYANEGMKNEFDSETTSLTFQNFAVNFFKGKIPPTQVDKISKAFNEMKTRATDLKDSEQDIIRIIKLTDEKNETEAFSQLKAFAYGTLSLSEGFLGDLLTSIFGSADERVLKTDGSLYDNGKKSITADYLKTLQDRISNAPNSELAELEAIRISVAFKMARAADPSGRLSNQDIELQLRKLGGGLFQTPSMALTKLNTVLRDIRRGRKVLDVIVNFGRSGDYMTKNDQRFFDGIITANELYNRKEAIDNNVNNKAKDTGEIQPNQFRKTTTGIYQDSVHIGPDLNYYNVPNYAKGDFSIYTLIPDNELEKYKKKP